MVPLELTDTPQGKALLVQDQGGKLPSELIYCGLHLWVRAWSAPWHTIKYGDVRYAYI